MWNLIVNYYKLLTTRNFLQHNLNFCSGKVTVNDLLPSFENGLLARTRLAILLRFRLQLGISHLDSPIQHHFLNVAIAQGKGVLEPDTMANDFSRKAVTGVYGQRVAI